jgi:hypothetical protein
MIGFAVRFLRACPLKGRSSSKEINLGLYGLCYQPTANSSSRISEKKYCYKNPTAIGLSVVAGFFVKTIFIWRSFHFF